MMAASVSTSATSKPPPPRAEEAATAYARSEYGRPDAAKLLQPRPAPTAAGAEAIQQAEREGLTLATSSNSTGYTRRPETCGRRELARVGAICERRIWRPVEEETSGVFFFPKNSI